MPRSAKAGPTTKKRTTKRSASRQPVCYEIPESPGNHNDLPQQSIESTSETGITSPIHSQRGRSVSTSTTTLNEDLDATPTTSKPPRKRTTSVSSTVSLEPKQPYIPGFEALEAVNGLYQKLKDGQAEIEKLHVESERLILQEKRLNSSIATLQAELKTEKEKVKKVQQAHEKEAEIAQKDSEKRLNDVLSSLRSFKSAASNIMPLLDVLTGAADIEYDDATEKLYRVLKDHKEQSGSSSATQPKKESND